MISGSEWRLVRRRSQGDHALANAGRFAISQSGRHALCGYAGIGCVVVELASDR